ncbi:phospholipase A2 inhibitor and Ly6/PLAUR domain-containing protein-like [Pantherophis guttatus]|uniref:Phospholipase A2 inhibitor and Ly6/PLAUR domain-containing protein-like n=1 Tax=Pantherophis guttatus TaxID=94885 RepID=A0A6P9DEV7_PANGU|nr:phospholipase A2 inhibitor and Ly6/PLAUR domain-containing protein-like [Pantherophis guttatus]
MKYLLLFTALIATANALNCQCSTCTGGTCTVETGQCYSIEREIATEKDKPVKVTIRGCQDDKVDPNICKQGFILMSSEKDFYLMSNITCCDKDLCDKDLNATLDRIFPTSDLVCPSCFALDKNLCDGKSMNCNDLQKKCFNISGTVNKKGSTVVQDFNARGCAVENTIFKKGIVLASENATYELENVQLGEAESKSGGSQISSCLSFAIFLPSVLWFLLDISLY